MICYLAVRATVLFKVSILAMVCSNSMLQYSGRLLSRFKLVFFETHGMGITRVVELKNLVLAGVQVYRRADQRKHSLNQGS